MPRREESISVMVKRDRRGQGPRLISRGMCLVIALAFGTAASAQPAPKTKIAFIGDSTGDGLWGGVSQLATRTACLKTSVDLGRFAKNSTGLTRPDRMDWAKETRKIGETFKPALYMMSLGLNDSQSVVEGRDVTPENSPAYPAKYKERVTAVLKEAQATNASMLWVGLAAMRPPAADKDARAKNKYISEAVAEFGVASIKYVEPWKLNPDAEEDKFASYGPDQNGRMVQIRSSDGEHFTSVGDLLVAVYLLPKMLASLTERGEPICKAEGQTP
jgi:hypothetical protein